MLPPFNLCTQLLAAHIILKMVQIVPKKQNKICLHAIKGEIHPKLCTWSNNCFQLQCRLIGVIIGGALGKIVSSLVDDLLMPLLGVLIGGINFTDLKYVITPASGDAAEVAFRYGAFIQSVVDFLIISFSIFLFVKALSSIRKKEPEPEPAPPETSNEELLLQEIRDLLKNK